MLSRTLSICCTLLLLTSVLLPTAFGASVPIETIQSESGLTPSAPLSLEAALFLAAQNPSLAYVIYLSVGDYVISSTLRLPLNTHLVGGPHWSTASSSFVGWLTPTSPAVTRLVGSSSIPLTYMRGPRYPARVLVSASHVVGSSLTNVHLVTTDEDASPAAGRHRGQ